MSLFQLFSMELNSGSGVIVLFHAKELKEWSYSMENDLADYKFKIAMWYTIVTK